MKIRFAELKDITRLVEIGKSFHANTRFRIYEYNAAMVEKKLTDLIVSGGAGKYVFFVADDSTGTIVGVLIGCLEMHIFSPKLFTNNPQNFKPIAVSVWRIFDIEPRSHLLEFDSRCNLAWWARSTLFSCANRQHGCSQAH
ncbi:MAG: hypothetical protein ACO1NO_09565 [Burkholderiaceae bacterium]